MNAQIRITGQISGNYNLLRKLNQYINKKEVFNDIVLEYESKTKAVEDLNNAFKKLCNEKPELKNKMGGIIKANDILYYDASKAEIQY
jgi:hypothetical protein